MNKQPKQPNVQDPNGSESESEDGSHTDAHGKVQEVAPSSCPPNSRCHGIIEDLKIKIRTLGCTAADRKATYQRALDRRERALARKDTDMKKLRSDLEVKLSKAKASADIIRANLHSRHRKNVEDLKLRR